MFRYYPHYTDRFEDGILRCFEASASFMSRFSQVSSVKYENFFFSKFLILVIFLVSSFLTSAALNVSNHLFISNFLFRRLLLIKRIGRGERLRGVLLWFGKKWFQSPLILHPRYLWRTSAQTAAAIIVFRWRPSLEISASFVSAAR